MPKNYKVIPNQAEVLKVAKALKSKGLSWGKIAERLDVGVSEEWFRRRLVPGYSEISNERVRSRFKPPRRTTLKGARHPEPRPISDEELKRLKERARPDDRDLTGKVFGDPPSWRSALARKMEGADA